MYVSVTRLLLIAGSLVIGSHFLWCQQPVSGLASFYHDSLTGNKTASGEVFRQDRFTAAHKTLPLGTWVLIMDREGHEVVVRINDRLPAHSSRMIDLTTRAAKKLKMLNAGLKRVTMKVITVRQAWLWYLENGYIRLYIPVY